MFNFINKYNQYKTTNSTNKILASVNGALNAKSMQLVNIMINGHANMHEATGKEVVVVNGNLHAKRSRFETLEVNGNAKIEDCTIAAPSEFSGNVTFENCTLRNLKLTGANFTLRNTRVDGDIKAIAINGSGKLILDNTIVRGDVVFCDGEIIYINGGKIENNQI